MLAARPAHAQAVTGAGDDAIPVSKGTVRIRIAGQWNDWSEVWQDSAGRTVRRGVLAGIDNRRLGVSALPQLSAAEAGIRTLTRDAAFSVSLGLLEARGDVRQSSAPIAVDVGITRRIAVGIVVPYIESRDNSQLLLNRAGNGATVGLNPTFGATTGPLARAANAALLRQIAAARAELSSEIARCSDVQASGCDAIRDNLAAAQALLARAEATQGAIAEVYGDSVRGGSPVVPFAQSLAGESVNGTIISLREAFVALGIDDLAAGRFPVGATTAFGPNGVPALAGDTSFGLGYRRIGNTRRAGIGDIDLTASYLLFDTFGGSQRGRLTNTGRALRSLVTAGWRFGSAGADDPFDPFDVPIGEGANALLLRSTTDVVLGRRLWASGSVRVVKPFADEMVVLAPLRTDSTTFVAFTPARASRALGTRIEIEAAPRLALGDFFGVSAAYLMRRTGSDALDVGDLRVQSGARVFQAGSVGVSFSTLASYVRRRSRLPLEVTYTHTFPISGSGGTVPRVASDRLELRVYTGFPRR